MDKQDKETQEAAYEEGWRAYNDERIDGLNPYITKSPEHHAWLAGWRAAETAEFGGCGVCDD
ncbi:MAG: hypothetical protein HQL53_08720 [Magnetococcales bacterium]|nr:hypothetical protein [Magnetococcales bacterium]